MDNGHQIPGTWYYTRSCAMRGVLVRMRLAPFVLLRSCGGYTDTCVLFAVMSPCSHAMLHTAVHLSLT